MYYIHFYDSVIRKTSQLLFNFTTHPTKYVRKSRKFCAKNSKNRWQIQYFWKSNTYDIFYFPYLLKKLLLEKLVKQEDWSYEY